MLSSLPSQVYEHSIFLLSYMAPDISILVFILLLNDTIKYAKEKDSTLTIVVIFPPGERFNDGGSNQ